MLIPEIANFGSCFFPKERNRRVFKYYQVPIRKYFYIHEYKIKCITTASEKQNRFFTEPT